MTSPEGAVLTSGAGDPSIDSLEPERIFCLGPEHTFSESLAKVLFFPRGTSSGGVRIPRIELTKDVDGVYRKLISEPSDGHTYGLIPVENTIDGSIRANLRPLVLGGPHAEVEVVAEATYEIRLFLAAFKNVKSIAEIERLYSFTSAFNQAEPFLAGHGLTEDHEVSREYPTSTAEAARLAKSRAEKKDEKAAAICSYNAANDYGLSILAEDIQGEGTIDLTRFYVARAKNGGPVPDLGRLTVGADAGGLADEGTAKVVGVVRPTMPWQENGLRGALQRFDGLDMVDYRLYRLSLGDHTNGNGNGTSRGNRAYIYEFVGAPETLHSAFADEDRLRGAMDFQLLGVMAVGARFR